MTRSAWDEAIEEYYAEHDEVRLGADARGPQLLAVTRETARACGGSGRPSTTPRATTTG